MKTIWKMELKQSQEKDLSRNLSQLRLFQLRKVKNQRVNFLIEIIMKLNS
jgi:hypothetical protein